MKNKCTVIPFYFFIIFYSLWATMVCGQTATSTTSPYKIVAVGNATQLKEKVLVSFQPCTQQSTFNKLVQDVAEVTRNDFSFYRQYFSVVYRQELPSSIPTKIDFNQLKNDGVHYVIAWNCMNQVARIAAYKINASNINSSNVNSSPAGMTNTTTTPVPPVTGVEVFNQVLTLSSFDRTQVHQIDDKIYQALTGRVSVFGAKVTFAAAAEWGRKKHVKEIYVMDFDGYNLKKVTNHGGIAISPAFSPDNQNIVYSLIDDKQKVKNIALYQVNLASGRTTKLLDKEGINSGAIYSSDGKGLYLTMSHRGNADIYYVDLATKGERQITLNAGEDVDPSVTKDGSLMTFLSNRAGRANVYTLNPSTGEKDLKRISFVGQFNATPRFSPDGSEIVFSSWVDRGFDLYRLSLSGNSLIRLTKNFGSNEDPTFSNDGEFITFSSRQSNSKVLADQKVYIMTREGEILGALTQHFVLCHSPRFSN